MPIEVDGGCVWTWLPSERKDEPTCDGPLRAVLGVAESVAKRHGGEVRLRSSGDGGVLVELRFPIPLPQA